MSLALQSPHPTAHEDSNPSTKPCLPRWLSGKDPVSTFASVGAWFFILGLTAIVMSPRATVVVAAAMAVVTALHFGSRRWPQVVGMVVSTLLLQTAAVVFSVALTPLLAVSHTHELGGAFLLAPLVTLLAACVAPQAGVHRGWTVALSHLPMWAAMSTMVWLPTQVSVAACLSTLAGVAIVVSRSRLSVRGWVASTLKKRVGKTLAVVLIGMLGAGMLTLAGPSQKAEAFDWSFGMGDKMLCGIVSPNVSPQPVGNGPEFAIPSGNLAGLTPKYADDNDNLMNVEWSEMQDGNSLDQYTLYEVAGLRGLNYINWVEDNEGENTHCSFMPWVGVTTGNMINSLGMFGLQAVIAIKEFAQVKNPFEPFYSAFTPTVNVLLTIMFSTFGLAYIVGLILFAFRAIKGNRGIQEAGRNAGGAVIVAFLAAIIYGGLGAGATWQAPNGNGFYTVVSWLDKTAGIINASVANEVLGSVQDKEGGMCTKPSGAGTVQDGQRFSSCLIAESMAYEPWSLAQFGPAGNKPIEPDAGSVPDGEAQADEDAEGATPLPCYNDYQGCNDIRTYLISQIGGPDISQRMQACLSKNEYDEEASAQDNHAALVACEPYHAVANDLMAKSENAEDSNATVINSYRAQSSGSNHFTQAFVSLLSTFTVGLGIVLFSGATIYWHARLFMLFLMGPLTLTMAAFKGAEHATKWISNVAQTVVMRLLYGIITTVIIFSVAQVATMDLNSGYRLLMLGFIIFLAFRLMRELDQMGQIGNSDGAASNSAFGGTFAGNMAASAVRGGIKSTGRMVKSGAKLGGAAAVIGATRTAQGAGKTAAFAARPARNMAANRSARRDGKRNFKEYQAANGGKSMFASRENDRANARAEQAAQDSGGRIVSPQQATQRPSAGNTPRPRPTATSTGGATSAAGTAGAAAAGAAAGAAASAATGRGGASGPKNNPKGSNADRSYASPRSMDAQVGESPRRTPNKRDRVRRAAGAARTAFSDPNGRSRATEQYRSELFHQWKAEENAARNEKNDDVLGFGERRQMRRTIKNATPEQIVESTKGLTPDEKYRRLAEMESEQKPRTRNKQRGQQPRRASKSSRRARFDNRRNNR